jgi:hypothetical protein
MSLFYGNFNYRGNPQTLPQIRIDEVEAELPVPSTALEGKLPSQFSNS